MAILTFAKRCADNPFNIFICTHIDTRNRHWIIHITTFFWSSKHWSTPLQIQLKNHWLRLMYTNHSLLNHVQLKNSIGWRDDQHRPIVYIKIFIDQQMNIIASVWNQKWVYDHIDVLELLPVCHLDHLYYSATISSWFCITSHRHVLYGQTHCSSFVVFTLTTERIHKHTQTQ